MPVYVCGYVIRSHTCSWGIFASAVVVGREVTTAVIVGLCVGEVVAVVIMSDDGVTVGVTVIDPLVSPPMPCIGFRTMNAPPTITSMTITMAAIVIPRRLFAAGGNSGTGGSAGGAGGGVSPEGGAPGTVGAAAPSAVSGGGATVTGSVADTGVSETAGEVVGVGRIGN